MAGSSCWLSIGRPQKQRGSDATGLASDEDRGSGILALSNLHEYVELVRDQEAQQAVHSNNNPLQAKLE